MSAYLGAVMQDFNQTEVGSPVSPFEFLQAFGTLFRGSENKPLNGETSQDANDFVDELLSRLHDEETGVIEGHLAGSTLVQELFGVRTRVNVSSYLWCILLHERPLTLISWNVRTADIARKNHRTQSRP